MARLLILSDLHLDHRALSPEYDGKRLDEQADVVVLAGDIHVGTKGLRWARETFPDKPIVYVAGNHEFFGQHWRGHLDAMHVLLPTRHSHDGPRVPARGEQGVHQKPAEATVAVDVGVDEHKEGYGI